MREHPSMQYTFCTGAFSGPHAHIWFAAVLLSRCWATVGCRLRNGTPRALMDEWKFEDGSGAECEVDLFHEAQPRPHPTGCPAALEGEAYTPVGGLGVLHTPTHVNVWVNLITAYVLPNPDVWIAFVLFLFVCLQCWGLLLRFFALLGWSVWKMLKYCPKSTVLKCCFVRFVSTFLEYIWKMNYIFKSTNMPLITPWFRPWKYLFISYFSSCQLVSCPFEFSVKH